ncbi:unnamed protein product, partial [marine sediment metagenome]
MPEDRLGEEIFSTVLGFGLAESVIGVNAKENSVIDRVVGWVKSAWEHMKNALGKAFGYKSKKGTLYDLDLSTINVSQLMLAISDDIKAGRVIDNADTQLMKDLVFESENSVKLEEWSDVSDIKNMLQVGASWTDSKKMHTIRTIEAG